MRPREVKYISKVAQQPHLWKEAVWIQGEACVPHSSLHTHTHTVWKWNLFYHNITLTCFMICTFEWKPKDSSYNQPPGNCARQDILLGKVTCHVSGCSNKTHKDWWSTILINLLCQPQSPPQYPNAHSWVTIPTVRIAKGGMDTYRGKEIGLGF